MIKETYIRDNIEKALLELFDRTLEKMSTMPEVQKDAAREHSVC
jgi:hypothetical protein